jgi:hypothetical protein
VREPQGDDAAMMEDLRRRFEGVLQGMLEGMWTLIQDEEVLDQCVGALVEWQTLIRRASMAGVGMTGRLPLGARGPLTGEAPPTDRGPAGGALGAP